MRGRQLRRLTAAAVAAVLLFAGCGGEPGGEPAAGPGPAAVATSLPVGVTGAVDLRRLVVQQAPDDYQLLASPPFGAVDLRRLLAEFSDAPAADEVILEDAGFQAGYTRGWQRESPRAFLGVFVFEFADEEGARSARDGFAAQNATVKGASRFPVASVAGAVGESYTRHLDERPPERVHLVTFVRGPRLYQVGGQFDDLTATVDETVRFAEAQDRVAG